MKVAAAITAGMRENRRRDLWDAMYRGSWGYQHCDRVKAWCWWGWNLNGIGGLGRPGADL